jgi:hypothetical protein
MVFAQDASFAYVFSRDAEEQQECQHKLRNLGVIGKEEFRFPRILREIAMDRRVSERRCSWGACRCGA